MSGAGVQVAPLPAGDVGAAAEVLARAFRDNPLPRVLLPGGHPERRLRAVRAGFSVLLPVAASRGTVLAAWREGRPVGILIGLGPGQWPLPLPPVRARLRALAAQGLRATWRLAELSERLARLHPGAPHAYLAALGVEPAFRGRGAGRALLARWLELTRGFRVPSYLETDREANLRFYGAAGFGVVGSLSFRGVAIWRMERPVAGPVEPPGVLAGARGEGAGEVRG